MENDGVYRAKFETSGICLDLLQRWEQLVVSKLKWELSAVTPGDFLMHILRRLPMSRTWNSVMVRNHAQTFISLTTRGENKYNLSELARLNGEKRLERETRDD